MMIADEPEISRPSLLVMEGESGSARSRDGEVLFRFDAWNCTRTGKCIGSGCQPSWALMM